MASFDRYEERVENMASKINEIDKNVAVMAEQMGNLCQLMERSEKDKDTKIDDMDGRIKQVETEMIKLHTRFKVYLTLGAFLLSIAIYLPNVFTVLGSLVK